MGSDNPTFRIILRVRKKVGKNVQHEEEARKEKIS